MFKKHLHRCAPIVLRFAETARLMEKTDMELTSVKRDQYEQPWGCRCFSSLRHDTFPCLPDFIRLRRNVRNIFSKESGINSSARTFTPADGSSLMLLRKLSTVHATCLRGAVRKNENRLFEGCSSRAHSSSRRELRKTRLRLPFVVTGSEKRRKK